MPLFEKINNHTLQQILLTEDTPVPLTKIERGWLKRMLELPASEDLLTGDLQSKLRGLLERETAFPETAELVEKGKTVVRDSSVGSVLKVFRTAIQEHREIELSYIQRNGEELQCGFGIACQLEFSMVRREWYLLWMDTDKKVSGANTTPLRMICGVRILRELPDWDAYQGQFHEWMKGLQRTAVIRAEECYSGALLSVLNAFSCFDTTVVSGEQKSMLQLRVHYLADEQEYVLQKIRFLGRRVTVEGPEEMCHRMRLTADWALNRYAK